MTQPVAPREREQFEVWLDANQTNACVRRGKKGYISEVTRVAWRAWRGAKAQSAIPVGWKLVLIDTPALIS